MRRHLPSPSQMSQSSGFCPDWLLGWGVWGPQNPGGLGVSMVRAKGLGGGGVRALAMDCHQMLDEDKKYNKKRNATP